MKNSTSIATVVLTLLLSACSGSDQDASKNETPVTTDKASSSISSDKSTVIATVNGKSLTKNMYDAYVLQRRASQGSQHKTENKAQIIEEMINFELLLQDAEQKGLQNEPDVATQLDLQRRNILVSAAFRDYTRKNPLTEEAMRKDYADRMSRIELTEYKLRHTLNDKEDDAKAIVASLEKGTNFSDVATKHSTGPSAAEGGDLGWLSPQDMVPGFKEAALKLEKGKYTSPVKTQFGWHVIYLEDTRTSPPPPFEQVRKQVTTIMQRKQIEDYINALRDSASINITAENMPRPASPSSNAADPTPGRPLKSEINMDNKY